MFENHNIFPIFKSSFNQKTLQIFLETINKKEGQLITLKYGVHGTGVQ